MARFELKLPKMGESVAEATITNWLKEVGDKIEADEAVLEIATDKVDSEVPSEVSGVLVEKLFGKDDLVQVGQTIAIIETEGGNVEAPSAESAPAVVGELHLVTGDRAGDGEHREPRPTVRRQGLDVRFEGVGGRGEIADEVVARFFQVGTAEVTGHRLQARDRKAGIGAADVGDQAQGARASGPRWRDRRAGHQCVPAFSICVHGLPVFVFRHLRAYNNFRMTTLSIARAAAGASGTMQG